MTNSTAVTREELELLIRKLTPVKKAGFGSLLIRVQNGAIVYVTQEIGEQVKLNIPE